ncbi:3-oxo-5a-steroid 4- dehydrogenase [Rhizophlyctis rosea]|nr:3-oxo-5a-steroid 4- dehydrogenase [Rhizophlyctis rosea]
MSHITLTTRSGRVLKEELQLPVAVQTANVEDLQKAIHRQFPKYYPSRQRLTFKTSNGDVKPLAKGTQLSTYGINSGDTIIFKDLGAQIGWGTVFLIEYAGPILIHPLLYFFPNIFYGAKGEVQHSQIQTITLTLVVLHFLKREYETLFVHRFSNDTMPIFNLPKNCAHYWLSSGVLMGYFIHRPGFDGGFFGGVHSSFWTSALIGFWLFSEVSNYVTHVTLRNLRPTGTRVRKIPFGYGFNLVSCPNYFFEILGWVTVSVLTGSLSAWLFTIIGAAQMAAWALKKHRNYKKEFGGTYPRNRKAMIPFIL